MAVGRPVHLVLDYGEKLPAYVRVGVVVDAGGINVEDLTPEYLFRRTDVPDAGQQLIEIVAAPGLLEPFVIECEALDNIFPQALGGPDTKPCGNGGF